MKMIGAGLLALFLLLGSGALTSADTTRADCAAVFDYFEDMIEQLEEGPQTSFTVIGPNSIYARLLEAFEVNEPPEILAAYHAAFVELLEANIEGVEAGLPYIRDTEIQQRIDGLSSTVNIELELLDSACPGTAEYLFPISDATPEATKP